MTRIAMLIPTIDQIGGAERQLLLLAKELALRGHQVTVIALSGTGAQSAEELQSAGIGFLSLEMRKAWIDPRGWHRYISWVTRNHPEIVHTHLPHATWFARWVRLIAPVPVLIDTIHTSDPGSLSKRLTYRLSHWLTNHVTCVSASVAASVVAAGITPTQNLTILSNGVELNEKELPKSRPTPAPFQWLAIGRLAPVKDYPTLLRAFATLPNNPHLKIAGSGPEESTLRTLASELGITDRVHFLGFCTEIQFLLSQADAFVQSSLWEGLPMSVLEASAAGIPVVATNATGTAETMQPGTTGLVVPVGDITAIASAMSQVMSMPPADRQQLGAHGRQFVAEHFSLPAITTRWEQLYANLLALHSHPSRSG